MLNLPMRKCSLEDGNSTEVGTAFEKLRQVILVEEFKRCVCNDIKTIWRNRK